MSMSEPFLPADEPRADAPPTDRDIDADVDVIRGEAGETPEQIPTFAPNPAFRTPVPGETLAEDQLERDLEEE